MSLLLLVLTAVLSPLQVVAALRQADRDSALVVVPGERRAAGPRLGLHLPSPFPPIGSYVNAVLVGDLLVLGGQVPWEPPDRVVLGRLGEDLDVDEGREAARLAGLNALASIREALGTLDRVVRVVSLRGVVNATPDFTAHTQVVDAASDVLLDVLGEAGRHARLAFGVSSLPANMALELELTVHVRSMQ